MLFHHISFVTFEMFFDNRRIPSRRRVSAASDIVETIILNTPTPYETRRSLQSHSLLCNRNVNSSSPAKFFFWLRLAVNLSLDLSPAVPYALRTLVGSLIPATPFTLGESWRPEALSANRTAAQFADSTQVLIDVLFGNVRQSGLFIQTSQDMAGCPDNAFCSMLSGETNYLGWRSRE
jgi:hypothetical protein